MGCAKREGMLAKRSGVKAEFPWIPGSEGAGRVMAIGDRVSEFRIGDLVYGGIFGVNPKSGFFAEYTALKTENAWPIPSTVTTKQAGALLIDGATALTGLDTLGLKQDEKLMIFGASGGMGHLAVQLAKRLGARVFAVASGEDGVELALKLGAEVAVDGHKGDIAALAREFSPAGFDAALITISAQNPEAIKASEKVLTAMHEGGRVAYPWLSSLMSAPRAPSNVRLNGYMGNMDRASVKRLNKLIEAGAFEVHLDKTFKLDQILQAFEAVNLHHLGRLALLPNT
jgi:NADPH:quinone reductase